MGLNLNLFVHGVPKGQNIWGPHEYDRNFVENFYGRKANVEVQFLVEVIQVNKNVNCYYTYFRKGNILDKDNRPGSYFALTVRSNAYYKDIANMYNILDAAYQKMILGVILQSDTSAIKFIVEDFDQVNKHLQDIEKEIINYLKSFSVDSDFIDLNGFTTNSKYEAAKFNLLECNPKNLLEHLKTTGNISVSPLHPTKEIAELELKKKEEIDCIKILSQQQILEVQNKAAQDILAEKKEKDDALNNLKVEYSSTHKTVTDLKNKITSLNNQLDAEKEKAPKLEDQLEKCKKELKEHEGLKQRLESKESELKNVNEILSSARQSLPGISGLAEILGATVAQTPINLEKPKIDRWLDKLNKFHALFDLIFMLILIGAIAFMIVKGAKKEIGITQNKIEQLQNGLNKVNDQLKENQEQLQNALSQLQKSSTGSTTSNTSESNKPVKIDIKEFNEAKQTMKSSESCHISIINATGGIWKSNDFTINGDVITPKRKGSGTIQYVINGVVVKSRTIKVED